MKKQKVVVLRYHHDKEPREPSLGQEINCGLTLLARGGSIAADMMVVVEVEGEKTNNQDRATMEERKNNR